METIRLCVLGAGRWGKRYIETIAAMDGVTLAAVASRNPDTVQIVPRGCAVFTDWHAAVVAPAVDAVVVATPPRFHAEMALAAMAARRPVLIEKPLALCPKQAENVERRASELGVLAMVGHTQLFSPGFRQLKRCASAIGPVRAIRCAAGNRGPFRPDVDPLWDWAPHDLAMCLSLLGALPDAVTAEWLIRDRIEGGHAGNLHLQLRFCGEVEVDIRVGNMMDHKHRCIEVECEAGRVVYDDARSTLVSGQANVPFSSERPLLCQVREFVEIIRSGCTLDPSLRIGRDIVDILARCERLMDAAIGPAAHGANER